MKLHEFFSYQLSINESAGNIVRLLGFNQEAANRVHQLFGHLDFTAAKVMLSAEGNFNPESKKFLLKNPPDWGYRGEAICINDAIIDLLDGVDDDMDFVIATERGDIEDMAKLFSNLFKDERKIVSQINSTPAGPAVLSLIKVMKDNSHVKAKAEQSKRSTKIMDIEGGWSWVDLGSCSDAAEASEMQHCGTDERGNLVSLRDTYNNARVTMTYNKEKGIVYQIKGKQNSEPGKPFWPAIKAFFEKTGSRFTDPDLSKELENFLQDHASNEDHYQEEFTNCQNCNAEIPENGGYPKSDEDGEIIFGEFVCPECGADLP